MNKKGYWQVELIEFSAFAAEGARIRSCRKIT